MEQGHFGRHVRRRRQVHAVRRRVLCAQLDRHLADYGNIVAEDGGLQLTFALQDTGDAAHVISAAREMDLGIEPLSRCGSRQSHEAGQMLEFGNCETRRISASLQQRDKHIGSD